MDPNFTYLSLPVLFHVVKFLASVTALGDGRNRGSCPLLCAGLELTHLTPSLSYPCSTKYLPRCAARVAIPKPRSDLISRSHILSGSPFILRKLYSPWPAMQSHVQYCLVNLCSLLSTVRPASYSLAPARPNHLSFFPICLYLPLCSHHSFNPSGPARPQHPHPFGPR